MTRGNSLGQRVLDAASAFLNHPLERHEREGNLQSDLEALLREIKVGSIESHYSTVGGEADIYLPNRRTFIELKAYPLAAEPDRPQQGRLSESPRQQLDRYVIGEINRELGRIPFDDVEFVRSNWVGILTDGRHWHVYEYGHRPQSVGEAAGPSQIFMNEALPLAKFLHSILAERNFGKEWIPGDPGKLFTSLRDDLFSLYAVLPANAAGSTRTKRDLWLDMMRTSGMVPGDEAGKDRLFVTHSFLIAVVRLVSHSLFPANSGSDWKPAIRDGFAAWVLEFERGRKWAGKLYRLVTSYDWRRREEDVLRSLYHHNVSAHDRKVFGEFYTPDWLAALMVEKVLDEEWMEQAINAAMASIRGGPEVRGIGVLDPTCGSGTFLLHAARRLLASKSMQSFTPVQRADIVSRLVNGIDIHPVAVELARVNLERILPAPPTMGGQAFQVHLGDSLQADSGNQKSLFEHTEDLMRVETPEKREIRVPMNFVRRGTFANDMREMVSAAAEGQLLPVFLKDSLTEVEVSQLDDCHLALTEVIAAEGNSVWTWYTINIAAPHLLAQRKVDRIVANPPWVKLAEIQATDRKRTLEQYGRSLGLTGAGKQAPHSDIASYFILAARKLYMAKPESNPASWLVKKSAIAAGQWEPFREVHRDTLRQTVDLEQLQPFGGGDATRSCLLMEHCAFNEPTGKCTSRLEARLKVGSARPKSSEPLESARWKFGFSEAPAQLPQKKSGYLNSVMIKQGATLVPHVLALLDEIEGPNHEGMVRVTTMRSTKAPWKEVRPQTGLMPAHWVRPVLTSTEMVAYIPPVRPVKGIVPVDTKGFLLENPGNKCSFWRELDEIYESRAGKGKSTPKALLKQFDFQSKLSAQLDSENTNGWIVLYPTSGDIMRAARITAGNFVVSSKLYWMAVRDKEEAGYLVALLNAACLVTAFRQCRESGRDFHLHPWWKVPIPCFNKDIDQHRRLAKLCEEAEKLAQEAASEVLAGKPGMSQVGISKAIRAAVHSSDAGREIEEIVSGLLPDQAVPVETGPPTHGGRDLFD